MATPIRFQGLVKTTAEIEADKFSGRVGWSTTLARYIAYYNSTQYAQMARRDVLETFAAGLQDSTLGVGLPMFAGTSGRLSTESAASFRSRIAAVNKAGDTMTGPLTLSAGDLNVGAGAIQTAGVTRISSGGAGTLTTLSTTGLTTVQSLNISGLTGPRMLSLDASKNAQTLDAAGSRALIGAMNRVPVTIDGQDLNTIVSNGLYQGDTVTNGPPSSGRGILRVYSANSDTGPLIWQAWSRPSYNGLAEFRRASSNSGSTWSAWVALSSDGHIEHPSITVAGVTRISSGGAGTLTTLSTTGLTTVQSLNISGLTGSRMLSLDASKNVVSLFPVTSIVRTIFRKHSSESLLINATARSVFNFGSNNTGSLNVSSAEMKTPGLKVVGKSVFTSSQAAGTVVIYQSSIAGYGGPGHTWTKAYASSVVEITSECLMMPGNDVSITTTLIETDAATGASKRFSGFQSDVYTISKDATEQFQTIVFSGTSFSVSVISAEQIMQ